MHVASLLEQEGVEVAFLGMVDSFLLDESFGDVDATTGRPTGST